MNTNIYNDEFFAKRINYVPRAERMVKAITSIYNPNSMIDCGAGIGDLVDAAVKIAGIDAVGIEGSPACKPHLQCESYRMIIADLAAPDISARIKRKYDILTCFEVAEHIETHLVSGFVDNLCKLSGILILSICTRGEVTPLHRTVRPEFWWQPHFEARGYKRCIEHEMKLKIAWDDIKDMPGVKEPYRNLMIFIKLGCNCDDKGTGQYHLEGCPLYVPPNI